MSQFINTTTSSPEDLAIAMVEELVSEVKYEMLDEVLEEVFSENPTPMSCEDFLEVLRPHFQFLFLGHEKVIYDEEGRCHSRYFRDNNLDAFLNLGHDWGFEDCRRLAYEVLHVVQQTTVLGVIKAFAIRKDDSNLGITLPHLQDRIFARFGGCRHPFDIVGTILHAVAHQMVVRTPHHGACSRDGEGHCPVWQKCVKVLTAAFAQAPKSSPYLNLLKNEYGHGWEEFLVQGATACSDCGETVAERLMLEHFKEDVGEIKHEILYTDAQTDQMAKMKIRQMKKKFNIEVEDEAEDEVILIEDDDDEDIEIWLWRVKKMGWRSDQNLNNYQRKLDSTKTPCLLSQNHFHLEMVLTCADC